MVRSGLEHSRTPGKINTFFDGLITIAQKESDPNLVLQLQLLKCKRLLEVYYKDSTAQSAAYNQQYRALQEAVNKCRTSKDNYLYPYALDIYADQLSLQQNYNASFEQRLKAYDIYRAYTISEFPAKVDALRGLASEYYRYTDYRNVIRYLDEILNDQTDNSPYNYTVVNTKALSYRALKQYDSAMYYFQQMADSAYNKAEAWTFISKLNIAHTYFVMGEDNKAKELFRDTYNMAKNSGRDYGVIESATILGTIALRKGNVTEAKKLLTEAEHLINTTPYWYYKRHLDAKKLFSAFTELYAHEQNFKLAYLYSDTLRMVSDSMNRLFDSKRAAKTEQLLLLDKYKQEQKNLKLEKEKQEQTRNAIIGGILLLSIISLLVISRQRLRRKKLEAEKQVAETKLASSRKQLNDYTANLQEKNKLLEQFKDEIEQYKSLADDEERLKTIQKLQESTILTDEDWNSFRQMFEEVHTGFIYRLKEKLPDLTPGEIRFLVLSKLKLSTKEMANILGVGTSTIRKYKHQVRQKLGLSDDDSIERFIDML